MFTGFNDATMQYFLEISQNNTRENYKQNESLYYEGIRQPLEEMYYELAAYFSMFDEDLISSKRRCISYAYNDARFCCHEPIKEYFYIRFKLPTANKKNEIGFYFDASLSGYKYGLNIYNSDAAGMERIRCELLKNKEYSLKLIKALDKEKYINVVGEKYKRSCYLEEDEALQDWLDRKRIGFCYESPIDKVFFERQLFENMIHSFSAMSEVYVLLKRTLI